MKKIISILMVLMLLASPAFSAWLETEPAGTQNASDIDTLVIANNGALKDALEDMRGWKNLKVVRDSATQVTVTADEMWLQYSGDLPRNFTTVSEAIAITTSGASGLDTGTESSDAWYYIWIIAKADNTINGLLSASSTSPTLPSGYVYKTLVSAVHNTSGDFVDFVQTGYDYEYAVYPVVASGLVGSATWTAIDTTAYVPSAISDRFRGNYWCFHDVVNVSNRNDQTTTPNTQKPNSIGMTSDGFNDGYNYFELTILTSNTLYHVNGSSSNAIYCAGFKITKL